jgi:hypothetical protein
MKATSIQIGRSYEITFKRSILKVKVKNFDPKHGSWICETENRRSMTIKDPKRFLKEIDPKEPKEFKEPEWLNESKIPEQEFVDQFQELDNKNIPEKTLPKKNNPRSMATLPQHY